jgi:G3E family GTPase
MEVTKFKATQEPIKALYKGCQCCVSDPESQRLSERLHRDLQGRDRSRTCALALVIVTSGLCSSVHQFTPHEAGVE